MDSSVSGRRHFPTSGLRCKSGKKVNLFLLAVSVPARQIHMCPSFRDIVLNEPGNRRDVRVKRPLNGFGMAVRALALHQFPQGIWNLRAGQQAVR